MYEKFKKTIEHLVDINESMSSIEKDFARVLFDQIDEDVITPRLEYCPYESVSKLRSDSRLNPIVGVINLSNVQDLMAKALIITHPTITIDDLRSSFTDTCVDIYVEALAMTVFDENGKRIKENTKPEKTFEGLQEVFGQLINQNADLGDNGKDFAKKVLSEIDHFGALNMVTYCPYKSAEACRESGHNDENYPDNLHTVEVLSKRVIKKNLDHPFASLVNESFITVCANILIDGIAKYAFDE